MTVDTLRIENYNAGTIATTVGLKIAARLTGMKATYAAIANDIQPIEEAASTVMNAQGTPAAVRPAYYNFTRELWKKTKMEAGVALSNDAQRIKDRYEDYGLVDATLIAIALDVFALVVT